jgi:hypothetical protein
MRMQLRDLKFDKLEIALAHKHKTTLVVKLHATPLS